MTRSRGPSGLDLLVRQCRAEASLWRRFRFEARRECRETLFNLYAGLARAIASRQFRRCGTRGTERGEFEQLAYEGLLQAIDRFDPLQGAPFAAYARRRISGSILDGIARMSEVSAQISHWHRVEQERVRSLADAPSDEAANALTRLSGVAIGLALGMMLEGTRLIEADDGADPAPSAYEGLEWRELKARLAHEVSRLPPNEALIIRQHYDNGLSFARIADLLDLSRGRISQLHRQALERLGKRVGGFV